MKKNNLQQSYKITGLDRAKKNKHNAFLIWFTGLSGSGKSTLADALEQALFKKDVKTYVLDGDNVRDGLNNDLTFSPKDRTENLRRIVEVSKLMIDAGLVVIAAFVSPYKKDRDNIRKTVIDINFVEVFVNTSLEVCEHRDVKGLYKKARAGEITNMTGISAPYEAPEQPDIEIKTEESSIEDSVNEILKCIAPKLKLNNE